MTMVIQQNEGVNCSHASNGNNGMVMVMDKGYIDPGVVLVTETTMVARTVFRN